MLNKRDKRSTGQTLIEFALVLPVLILIVMGVFEFGRMLQAWLTVQNCAQTAARYATTGQHSVAPVVDQWDSTRLAAIKAEALRKAVSLSINNSAGAASPGYFRVNVYASDPPIQGAEYPGGPNARVAVDVIYNHALITPLLNMIAPYITLRAHSEMINERFRHPGYGTPVGVLPPTIFPTPAPSKTSTVTTTPTPQSTRTVTPTGPTPTATASVRTSTPTVTLTVLATTATIPTRTATATTIPTITRTPTRTLTLSSTPTSTRTNTPTMTQTPTRTPTRTPTLTPTPVVCTGLCRFFPLPGCPVGCPP